MTKLKSMGHMLNSFYVVMSVDHRCTNTYILFHIIRLGISSAVYNKMIV